MITFAIDQGNSTTKIAFFSEGRVERMAILQDETLINDLQSLLGDAQPTQGIMSSVRHDDLGLLQYLESVSDIMVLNSETQLPFGIDYETPATLGADRKANCAALFAEFGESNALVVDCGTCITYSLMLAGRFSGGAISPGIRMRLKALHHYTGRLPEISQGQELPPVLGKSTEGSIRAGVEYAIVREVEKMIDEYCSQYAQMSVILTGGSMSFFERHLKTPIFARSYLTLTGLHEIFLYTKKRT